MTTDERLERDLPDLLAQLAPRAVPDYRDAVVQRTGAMSQRPAWTFPTRWLPAAPSAPLRSRQPMWLTWIAVVALLGALIATLTLVGSRQRTLPPPFGPAENGDLFFASSGDIYRLDGTTWSPRSIVTGSLDTAVTPSRDGTRLAIVRDMPGGPSVVVVTGADGRNERTLPGRYASITRMDWSPNGREIAIRTDGGTAPAITILSVDGSGSRELQLGVVPGTDLHYLPDGRILIDGGSLDRPSTDALYLLDPTDGSAVPITTPTTDDLDIIGAVPSPDGTKVVYHRWREPDEKGRIRVIDVESGTDTALPVNDPDGVFTDLNPAVSPDGQQIFFTRYTAAGNELVVVPATGGTPVPIGEYTPSFDAPEAAWSPDGRSIIARYHNGNVWLLDATGTGTDRRLDLDTPGLPAWQRVGG